MSDLISRADAICEVLVNDGMDNIIDRINALPSADVSRIEYDDRVELSVSSRQKDRVILKDAFGSMEYVPSADAVQGWIPCSDKLPSDDEIVNITWVNHNPPPYYTDIAEKPFVASGLRYRDKWYWYSSVCQDLHQDFDLIDKDIEVIAWQPLPKPYKGGDTE